MKKMLYNILILKKGGKKMEKFSIDTRVSDLPGVEKVREKKLE